MRHLVVVVGEDMDSKQITVSIKTSRQVDERVFMMTEDDEC